MGAVCRADVGLQRAHPGDVVVGGVDGAGDEDEVYVVEGRGVFLGSRVVFGAGDVQGGVGTVARGGEEGVEELAVGAGVGGADVGDGVVGVEDGYVKGLGRELGHCVLCGWRGDGLGVCGSGGGC